MLRVVISQRLDLVDGYNEVRDSVDRAWYSVLQDICSAEVCIFPIPNTQEFCLEFLQVVKPNLILLTGGNDILSSGHESVPVRDRNAVEEKLLEYALGNTIPVVGVCRGFQFLNAYLEGGMHRVPGHIATYHEVFFPGDLDRKPVCKVNSYHSFAVSEDEVATGLRPVLMDCDNNVEAVIHSDLPWVAVMWHPERQCEDGSANIWLKEQILRILH